MNDIQNQLTIPFSFLTSVSLASIYSSNDAISILFHIFVQKKKIENLKFMIKNDALFIRTHHYVYHYELSTKQGIEVLQFCTKYYRIAIINMANGIMYI